MDKKVNTARIPEGKKRIMITLELDTIAKIEELASANKRSVSNEIAVLIEEKYQAEKKQWKKLLLFLYLSYKVNNYRQTTLVVVINMDILDMDKTKYGLEVIYALLKNEEFALLYRKNLHFQNFKSEEFALLR